jgi:hypothetical protein
MGPAIEEAEELFADEVVSGTAATSDDAQAVRKTRDNAGISKRRMRSERR